MAAAWQTCGCKPQPRVQSPGQNNATTVAEGSKMNYAGLMKVVADIVGVDPANVMLTGSRRYEHHRTMFAPTEVPDDGRDVDIAFETSDAKSLIEKLRDLDVREDESGVITSTWAPCQGGLCGSDFSVTDEPETLSGMLGVHGYSVNLIGLRPGELQGWRNATVFLTEKIGAHESKLGEFLRDRRNKSEKVELFKAIRTAHDTGRAMEHVRQSGRIAMLELAQYEATRLEKALRDDLTGTTREWENMIENMTEANALVDRLSDDLRKMRRMFWRCLSGLSAVALVGLAVVATVCW